MSGPLPSQTRMDYLRLAEFAAVFSRLRVIPLFCRLFFRFPLGFRRWRHQATTQSELVAHRRISRHQWAMNLTRGVSRLPKGTFSTRFSSFVCSTRYRPCVCYVFLFSSEIMFFSGADSGRREPRRRNHGSSRRGSSVETKYTRRQPQAQTTI